MCVCVCRVLRVVNRHMVAGQDDVLFHFGLTTVSHDLQLMFSDVKVIHFLHSHCSRYLFMSFIVMAAEGKAVIFYRCYFFFIYLA